MLAAVSTCTLLKTGHRSSKLAYKSHLKSESPMKLQVGRVWD